MAMNRMLLASQTSSNDGIAKRGCEGDEEAGARRVDHFWGDLVGFPALALQLKRTKDASTLHPSRGDQMLIV